MITTEFIHPLSILPQVGLGSATPKPRNESDDSVSIQVAKSRVAVTIITEITFGIICLNTIVSSLIPMALAAVTNSCSRSAST